MKKQIGVYMHCSGGFSVNLGKEDFDTQDIKAIKKEYTLILINTKRDPIYHNNKRLNTLKEHYDYYNACAKELYTHSKGKVNMYYAGGFTHTAVYLWRLLGFNKGLEVKPEPLTDTEVEFLKGAKGAIIFGEKYYGTGHMYDFCSFYQGILSDNHFLIPIKPPTERTINKLSEVVSYDKLSYGFYHIEIQRSKDEYVDRLFRFNDKNIYTHTDIHLAMKLGLKRKLIIDGKTNFWHYERKSLVTGYQVFNNFVSYMFKLKDKKVMGAKNILNCLWGALCQQRRKVTTKPTEKEQSKIIAIRPNEDGELEFTIGKSMTFKFAWARLKPFLLAEGRMRISTTLKPFGDKIVRCHTDGFIAKEKLDIKTGLMKGEIKYEGYSEDVEVVNSNLVKGKEEVITVEDKEAEEMKRLNEAFEKMLKKDYDRLHK